MAARMDACMTLAMAVSILYTDSPVACLYQISLCTVVGAQWTAEHASMAAMSLETRLSGVACRSFL